MPLSGVTLANGEKKCAFARVIHETPEAGDAALQMGGSAPMRVYVNGKPVWDQKGAHGYHPNADRVTVTLAKGRNEIVVCTTWMAYLNLVPVPVATK